MHDIKEVGVILLIEKAQHRERYMAGAKKRDDRLLKAVRRTNESDFALLTYYNAENNRARSLTGFQERLEIATLASNLKY